MGTRVIRSPERSDAWQLAAARALKEAGRALQNLRSILIFGAPYLARYRTRMVLGILLGVFYGVSNGAAIWGARFVFERLSGVTASSMTTSAGVSPRATIATEKSTTGKASAVDLVAADSQRWAKRAESWTRERLGPWLPEAGRKPDWKQALGLMLLLPFLMALRGYTGYFSNYFLSWVSERMVSDLRLDVLTRLSGLSVDYFSKARSGDLITRINSDALTLQIALGSRLSDLVKEPVTIASIVLALLLMNPALTLFVVVFLPLCALPISRLGRKARESARRVAQAATLQSGLLVEFLAGIRVVKAFGLESQQLDRFRTLSRESVGQGMRAMRAREMVNPIIEIISAFALSALILYIAFRSIQFTDLLTFLGGTAILYTPVRRLSQLHVGFAQASVAAERIGQILREQPSVRDPVLPRTLRGFEREIVFDRVGFGYDERPVLSGFSLTIPRGQKLGVAGESGSGKSTLVNLLFRFYDPTSGCITIDGIDLREAAGAQIREHLALVSQDVVVFDLTVAENIACGRPGATRADVVEAARAAFAHDFIMALPQGYDTPVGERGVTLSGGQRQRLSIARAFVRNAPILVLDEATASLDSQSEREVQTAIERLEENRTVLCVAHRLSTLINMDRVITLSEGRILESGTPQELLRAGGSFAAMARLQGIEVPLV